MNFVVSRFRFQCPKWGPRTHGYGRINTDTHHPRSAKNVAFVVARIVNLLTLDLFPGKGTGIGVVYLQEPSSQAPVGCLRCFQAWYTDSVLGNFLCLETWISPALSLSVSLKFHQLSVLQSWVEICGDLAFVVLCCPGLLAIVSRVLGWLSRLRFWLLLRSW